MATTNQKMLEFERLKSMASNGHVHDAIRELLKIAEKNHLDKELEELQQMKKSLEFLDAHLQANSIDSQFGGAKRNRLIFDLLELINHLRERKGLDVPFHHEKDVNLVLSPMVGLSEEKKSAIVKTLEKILGVSGENIRIEQMASR